MGRRPRTKRGKGTLNALDTLRVDTKSTGDGGGTEVPSYFGTSNPGDISNQLVNFSIPGAKCGTKV